MRASIRGYVGDPSFAQALAALRQGGKRWTLFVTSPRAEKLLHLGREEAFVLSSFDLVRLLSADGPYAPLVVAGDGAVDGPYREAAGRLLEAELGEVVSWTGAPFELAEGPLPREIPNGLDLIRIRCAPSELLASWKAPPPGTPSPEPGEPASGRQGAELFGFTGEPQARLETLSAAAARPAACHVAYRELAASLKDLGLAARAASCLREVARRYQAWGQDDLAAEALFEAVGLCPVDLNSMEDLLRLRVDPSRRREVDAIVERTFGQLEILKQYDLVVRLFRLVERPPESAAFHRLVGEGLLRAGETADAIREILLAAKLLRAARDREGAERVYARLLEIDPSLSEAHAGIRTLRAGRRLRGHLLRWGTLAAALLLGIAWVLWDVSSAAALAQLGAREEGQGLRRSLEMVREDARRFPLSRHLLRLVKVETDLYREAFAGDRGTLLDAIVAQAEGDFPRARALYSSLASSTVIPFFAERAEAGRSRIAEIEQREEALLRGAEDGVRSGHPEEAFRAYRELLLGVDRSGLSASPVQVPILVETVPPGASIEHRGQLLGTTPCWIAVPPDPTVTLRLWKRGYQPLEIPDPLQRLFAEDSPRLFAALSLPKVWWSRVGGGISTGAERGTVLAVQGADGVLRAFDAARASLLWETPFDGLGAGGRGAMLAGPAVISDKGRGSVFAFSLSSGTLAWATRLGTEEAPVRLCGVFAGQVLMVARGQAILLNPLTGLPVRRIHLGREYALGATAVCESTGVFALRGGGLAGANLRTGHLEFVRWKEIGEVGFLLGREPDALVVRRPEGLTGLPLAGGDHLWHRELRPDQRWIVGAGRDRVSVGSASGEVQGLDARTGETRWSSDLQGQMVELCDPEGSREIVVAVIHRSGRQIVVGVSPSDGSRIWEVDTGFPELVSVHLVGQILTISTPSTGVVAFATGS